MNGFDVFGSWWWGVFLCCGSAWLGAYLYSITWGKEREQWARDRGWSAGYSWARSEMGGNVRVEIDEP